MKQTINWYWLIPFSLPVALQFKHASDWVELHRDGVQPQVSKSYSVTTVYKHDIHELNFKEDVFPVQE